MQHYEHFTPTDFACDDAFLSHHLSPTGQSAQFWAEWLTHHPHRRDEWTQGGHLLEAVRSGLSAYARTYLSEEAEAQLLARIQATNARIPIHIQPEAPVIPLWRTAWVTRAAAACFLLALGVSIWFYTTRSGSPTRYQQQVASLPPTRIETVNTTDKSQLIQLPDGSAVRLSPQSRLSYAADFGREERTVYLLGEANFDVAKNPEKPFYVYANELVTKVLGTKFSVKAFARDKNVTVMLQHGQVSVYRDNGSGMKPTLPASQQNLTGVLLLPNQQVVFARQTEQFTKSLVAEPVLVQENAPVKPSFVFDETPVPDVFARLEKAYGIDIVYNADALTGCQLTASLTDEPLFQKLDVITQSIGATYELVDGQVVITAKGCTPD